MGRPLLLGCRLLAGASRLPMARIVEIHSAPSLCCHFASLQVVLYGDFVAPFAVLDVSWFRSLPCRSLFFACWLYVGVFSFRVWELVPPLMQKLNMKKQYPQVLRSTPDECVLFSAFLV